MGAHPVARHPAPFRARRAAGRDPARPRRGQGAIVTFDLAGRTAAEVQRHLSARRINVSVTDYDPGPDRRAGIRHPRPLLRALLQHRGRGRPAGRDGGARRHGHVLASRVPVTVTTTCPREAQAAPHRSECVDGMQLTLFTGRGRMTAYAHNAWTEDLVDLGGGVRAAQAHAHRGIAARRRRLGARPGRVRRLPPAPRDRGVPARPAGRADAADAGRRAAATRRRRRPLPEGARRSATARATTATTSSATSWPRTTRRPR